jgi:hypothetical protein
VQYVGDLATFECVHRPQGRRFERLLSSLHDPAGHAIAPALQELVKGRGYIDGVELLRVCLLLQDLRMRLNLLTELHRAAAV